MTACYLQRAGMATLLLEARTSVGGFPVAALGHPITAVATPLRKGEYSAEAEGRPIYYLHRFDDAGGFVTETRFAGVPALAEQDDNA